MVLVIDPQIAGIAGDMLLCSLVDIGADAKIISATKLILETDKQHNLHTGKNVADCIAATCIKIFQR